MKGRILKLIGLLVGHLVASTCPVWIAMLVTNIWSVTSPTTLTSQGYYLVVTGFVALTLPFVPLWWGFVLAREESTLYRIWTLTKCEQPTHTDPTPADWR